MKTSTKTLKAAAAQKQIATLQAEKARIQDAWLTRGMAKTEEMVDAISSQIISLYEELDALEALEAEETSQKGRTENDYHQHSDEIGVTPLELAMVAHLGWGPAEIIKQKRRAARR